MHDGVVVEGERIEGRDGAGKEGADQHHQHDRHADVEGYAPPPLASRADGKRCRGGRHRRAILGSREACSISVTRKTKETRIAKVRVSPWMTG